MEAGGGSKDLESLQSLRSWCPGLEAFKTNIFNMEAFKVLVLQTTIDLETTQAMRSWKIEGPMLSSLKYS